MNHHAFVLFLAPVPALIALALILISKGELSIILLFFLSIFWPTCWLIGFGIVASNKRLVANQIFVDIKPNIIIVSDGSHFPGYYSSDSRLFADMESLKTTLYEVSERRLKKKKSFFMLKESAYIRLWPMGTSLSGSEVAQISEIACRFFLCTSIEIISSSSFEQMATHPEYIFSKI